MGLERIEIEERLKMGKVKKKKKAGKAEDKVKVKKEGKVKKEKEKKKERKKKESVCMKDLVFGLGGDEQDLEIVQETKSGDEEEEIETGKEFSKEARKELEKLIKDLGLEKKFRDHQVLKGGGDEELDQESVQIDEVSSTTKAKENESGDEKSQDEEEEGEEAARPVSPSRPQFHFTKEKIQRRHCLVKILKGEERKRWTHLIEDEGERGDEEKEKETVSEYWMGKMEKYAEAVLAAEVENKASSGKRDSEAKYIEGVVLKSGVLGDKISAMAVLLQEDPVHNLRVLDSLIDMVSLKKRRPCMMAMDVLKDLFVDHLLAEDRKLLNFRENDFAHLQDMSGGNKDRRDLVLMLWLFEHKLKVAYSRFISALDEVAKDQIEKSKTKAMSVFLELLISNPENEQELLSRLVNKLGDPTRTVAAKAVYQLKKLLEAHPAMKMVVVKEVERILYRSNVNPKAQYYGVCFLSQILLEEEDDQALAAKLIKIYFGFFKACVKKGDIDSKIMSALLTGVNRAFPYAKLDKESLDEQLQIMFRVVQLSSFNTSVQALMLIYQIMDFGQAATDRFYSALYRKILDPRLANSTKHTLFLNLIYKAMKKDSSVNRLKAFMKRIFQVCHYLPSQLTCGCLFLLSEISKSRPEIKDLEPSATSASLAKFEGEDEDEDEHYDDADKPVEEDGAGEAPGDKSTPSWVHQKNLKSGVVHRKGTGGYDPTLRNPMFCGAEKVPSWELSVLSSHFHPSASLFAGTMAKGGVVQYPGDPLQDFTMMHFLDRFVFRNPKKDPNKGKPQTVLGKRKTYTPVGIKSMAPDSKDYANKEESSIPPDEAYIYKYFRWACVVVKASLP